MNYRLSVASISLIAVVWLTGLANPQHPILVDVTKGSGLENFKNVQGSTAKQHIIETMGGGAAFLDYDGDGNLDVKAISQPSAPASWFALARGSKSARSSQEQAMLRTTIRAFNLA